MSSLLKTSDLSVPEMALLPDIWTLFWAKRPLMPFKKVRPYRGNWLDKGGICVFSAVAETYYYERAIALPLHHHIREIDVE